MTPEERAWEVACGIVTDDDTYDMAEKIATALRQAQNDKLEEAADAATKFLVGDPFNGVPLRSPGPHEIAAHIRSLKLKD